MRQCVKSGFARLVKRAGVLDPLGTRTEDLSRRDAVVSRGPPLRGQNVYLSNSF
jgi:hypothetical protein